MGFHEVNCSSPVGSATSLLVYRPPFRRDEALKMLLFDSTYNTFRGVVNSVAVMNGVVRKGTNSDRKLLGCIFRRASRDHCNEGRSVAVVVFVPHQ